VNDYVIIAAGGVGARMNSTVPKQFIVIHLRPIIFHTIQKFVSAIPAVNVIVVLPFDQFEHWHKLCKDYNFNYPCQLAKGGKTRFDSVKSGLELIKEDGGVVGVHDAVRPLVSETLIKQAYKTAKERGSAIPVVELKDSIREVSDVDSKHIDRIKFRLVQTPQCFSTALIKRAYNQPYHPNVTDDATLVERLGEYINLIDGEEFNIKITTPFDLKVAETLLVN